MRMKRFLWFAAWTCLLLWAVRGALFYLHSRGVARGSSTVAWFEDDSPAGLALSYLTAAAMLTCWIGSLYAWARSVRRGFAHGLALMTLIFVGMVVGPFYILAAMHTLPPIEAKAAAA